MLKSFKEFIMKGSVLDLAVGIIIGAAFTSVVNSLVNDILMPPIGLLVGNVDFSNLFINLSGEKFASLADAQVAGAPTLNYGLFINSLINFLIVSLAIFLLVRLIQRTQREPEPEAEELKTKECSYCYSMIAIQATRCPHCTSNLE